MSLADLSSDYWEIIIAHYMEGNRYIPRPPDIMKLLLISPDLYNNIIVQEKNTCFYKIAMNTNNSSLCNKFDDPEIIDTGNYLESKSPCYFKMALNTNNSSLCDNVNTITVQEITPDPNAPPCVGAGACVMPVIRFNWTMSKSMCNNEINGIYLDLTCPEEAPNCTYDIYNNLRSD